ncbi:MAG: hypothetical protein ABEH47_05350 [Haloferacaceae archaeon]
MRPRIGPLALLAVALAVAGCAGVAPAGDAPTADATTATESPRPATPPPAGSVDLPDGPKDPPERPSRLTASTVREYVRTYEYRYAYNSLWVNEHTEVTLDCRVDDVTERSWGYEAVVTCTGYSNTRVPENSTATPGPHADWFTQSYRYLVSENATHRRDAAERDPAS